MLYRLKWPCNDEVSSKAILEDFYDSNRVWMVCRLHRNALFDIWLLLGSINQISRGGGEKRSYLQAVCCENFRTSAKAKYATHGFNL